MRLRSTIPYTLILRRPWNGIASGQSFQLWFEGTILFMRHQKHLRVIYSLV